MVYSDDYKFIFFAVPKTGSRSIQEYLQNYGIRSKKGWNPNHDNYEQIKNKLGEDKCKKYFKFAFFRNPWSMLISTFFYNRNKLSLPPDKKTVIQWLNTYSWGDPYVPYLFDKDGNMILDYVGKLEHLREDFTVICKKMNISVPESFAHLGKQNVKGRLHYIEYYTTPQLVKKIQEIFSQSQSVLKYEFEDAPF